jgi:hypothetical protein
MRKKNEAEIMIEKTNVDDACKPATDEEKEIKLLKNIESSCHDGHNGQHRNCFACSPQKMFIRAHVQREVEKVEAQYRYPPITTLDGKMTNHGAKRWALDRELLQICTNEKQQAVENEMRELRYKLAEMHKIEREARLIDKSRGCTNQIALGSELTLEKIIEIIDKRYPNLKEKKEG